MPVQMSPDMIALALTVGHCHELATRDATTAEWEALTQALVETHTPEQLANMLTGAAAALARSTR